jgi:pseudouridine-5'-phosphate glycosidase
MPLPKSFKVSQEVQEALQTGRPIVALESTVITHGLPQGENLELARDMEATVRGEGAVPATIAVIDGRVCVGLEDNELDALARSEQVRKLSARDLAAAVSQNASGGTTVAGTLRVAAMAGIHVFATGGIGGVHRGSFWDVSADLGELAKQPVLLVCAGAKAILDLPATLEQFETLGVPVIGYGTDDYPAFYSIESGLKTSGRVDNAEAAASLAKAHWELRGGGILIANPIPKENALPREIVDGWIEQALSEAADQHIHGQAVSPFLLKRVTELSAGKSLQANLALLRNNAKVAAQIAHHLPSQSKTKVI